MAVVPHHHFVSRLCLRRSYETKYFFNYSLKIYSECICIQLYRVNKQTTCAKQEEVA